MSSDVGRASDAMARDEEGNDKRTTHDGRCRTDDDAMVDATRNNTSTHTKPSLVDFVLIFCLGVRIFRCDGFHFDAFHPAI
mgnify:CR=1 FL=1